MALPVIAIVGRPNVGKSSLFNMLVGTRTSIVEPTAGVTRDRVSAVCEIGEGFFELVDTGGHGIVDRDDLSEHVERQIQYAIGQACLVLLVVDAREGITPLDVETAGLIRGRNVPVQVVANKADEFSLELGIGEFTRLGHGEAIATSAISGQGRSALMELIAARLADSAGAPPAEAAMKLALVGKRNAGKSTFLNALAGEERVIVSEVPGTTRDSIDVRIEQNGRTIVAIDTAGVRKKSKLADAIEYYAMTRAEESIRRADVVLLLIDSTEPVGQVDKKLAGFIAEAYRPCVIVVNKWDLARDRAQTGTYGEYLTKVIPHLDYCPIAFCSARSGKNIQSVVDLASTLFEQSRLRVTTGKLNQVIGQAVAQSTQKSRRGSTRPRVYYATQAATQPPTIVLFVNRPELVTPVFERYLVNRMREHLPFDEVPIRLIFKPRRSLAAAGTGTR